MFTHCIQHIQCSTSMLDVQCSHITLHLPTVFNVKCFYLSLSKDMKCSYCNMLCLLFNPHFVLYAHCFYWIALQQCYAYSALECSNLGKNSNMIVQWNALQWNVLPFKNYVGTEREQATGRIDLLEQIIMLVTCAVWCLSSVWGCAVNCYALPNMRASNS